MYCTKVFGLICFVISSALTSPVQHAGDGLTDLVGPCEKSVFKRRIFEENADRQLKQISLSSLVSDIESNIFTSALSLNEALMNKNISVSEIKVKHDAEPNVKSDHQTMIKQEKIPAIPTKKSSAKVILENTEKVTLTKSEPAHILINRISIQPHAGGLTSIPTFELKRTGEEKTADQNPETTESKTATTSLDTTSRPYPSAISSTTSGSTLNSTTAAIATSPAESSLKVVTTPKNIEELKEAEEELKEKFAEIEAEPIILSARV